MFKDNEILKRISDLENTISAMDRKINALLEMWDTPSSEPSKESVEVSKKANEWRPVLHNGKPTLCEVSDVGTIRRTDTKALVPIHFNASGRPRANIYWIEEGKKRASTGLIANLVARAFIDEDLPLRSSSVRHIDGNEMNCCVDNLYVKRPSQNVIERSGKGYRTKL